MPADEAGEEAAAAGKTALVPPPVPQLLRVYLARSAKGSFGLKLDPQNMVVDTHPGSTAAI